MSLTIETTTQPIVAALEPNQLVTVKGIAGTHTIRDFVEARSVYRVDVLGSLVEAAPIDVTPHPGTPPPKKPGHVIRTNQESGLTTAVKLNTSRDSARTAAFTADVSRHPTLGNFTFSRDASFSGFAKVTARPRTYPVAQGRPRVLSVNGLEIQVTVTENLDLMAQPYDLVPVVLETNRGPLDTIVVLTLPGGQDAPNVVTFTVHYTLLQLLSLAAVTPAAEPEKQLAQVEQVLPELGVKATWLAFNGQNNADNHFSGGIENKNGSGKIKVVVPSLQALAESEKERITSWSVAEDLGPDRQVVTQFPALLQTGEKKEMATNVEAEAEFVLDGQAEYERVLKLFQELTDSPASWPKFGIVEMEAVRDKRTGSLESTYTDEYYDVHVGGECQWTLLSKKILLRHRSVVGDAGDVFLFALKGPRLVRDYRGASRTSNFPESLRLTAQVQLKPNPDGELLKAFLLDTSTDNAVGRILAAAIKKADEGNTFSEKVTSPWPAAPKKWSFAPALVVVSQRRKFSIKLANATSIDVTVDHATAHPANGNSPTAECFSFELGVGHPALITASGTSAVPEVTAVPPASAADTGSRITRPYHVPADLKPTFFQKIDYEQFLDLTVALLKAWYPDKPPAIGGNKAHLLAQKLRLIK